MEYRNRAGETIYACKCSLPDYCEALSWDIKRIVTDVEDLAYLAGGGKPKEDWSEAEIIAFNKIRGKLLDKAGEIARLPSGLFDQEEEKKPAAFWGRMFA